MRHLKVTTRRFRRRKSKLATSAKGAKQAPLALGWPGVYEIIPLADGEDLRLGYFSERPRRTS